MSVSDFLIDAFNNAIYENPILHKKWQSISHKAQSLLPGSTLPMTVQRDGDVDLILRSMEEELKKPKIGGPNAFHAHYQKYLSEMWIGSTYEVFRLLKARRLSPINENFLSLAEDLRLLRISLEKHEIPSDNKLKEPLQLLKLPANGTAIDTYEYSKNDPNRQHILPTGISGNGSFMWNVIFVSTDGSARERWLERLDLSNRMISAFDDVA